tara:strand:- start:2552 stop:3091 length:540 start_codon:yes stop_codon:yes gene_type:complete
MKTVSTKFSGLKIIESKLFRDNRGFFKEDFKKKFFKKQNFVFGCTSSSKKNVLRGMHLQTRFSQGKYVSVLKGTILDVVVDLRRRSRTFGKSFSIILSEKKANSIFIPPGFAHGFLGIGNENIIYYLCTNYRSKKNEVGLLWNDKDLKIRWPLKNPIVSKKDKNNMTFLEYKKKFYGKN